MNIPGIIQFKAVSPYQETRQQNFTPRFGLKMAEPIKEDTVSFKATAKMMGSRKDSISMSVAKSIHEEALKALNYMDDKLKNFLYDLVATTYAPENPIETITKRAKEPDSIREKAITRGWVKKDEIKKNMTDLAGMKIIMRSATLAGLDEGEQEEKSKLDIWLENKFGEKLTDYIIYFSVFISIILSIGIFMVLPVWISSFFTKIFNISLWGIGIIEGIVRILIFLGYILLISKMKDVQRLFKYHGAEHKTINCFESGDELTVENVRKHTRLHKRCGTSFLIIVMIVSMIVFMFLRTDNVTLRVLSRIILVPLIAGISYEIIKLAGKCDNIFVKIISAPGMALQKVTTKEPEDEMIETAILSLKGVLEEEGNNNE